jgi:hypothetical protein
MKLQRINQVYVHGWMVRRGNHVVEIVRAYAGEWLVFEYIDGSMVSRSSSETRGLTYWQAVKGLHVLMGRET